MAERYYGLDLGQTKNNVTEGSSSTATLDVEVRVDLAGVNAAGQGRQDVIIALNNIIQYITEDNWPPA